MIKKITILILILIMIFSIPGCKKSSDKNDSSQSIDKTTTESAVSTTSKASVSGGNTEVLPPLSVAAPSKPKDIENSMKIIICNEHSGTSIDSLTVTEAYDTPAFDDYKVYAIITLDKQYNVTDSRTTIENYSNNIATMVSGKLSNVAELSLSWLVPNLNGSSAVKYVNVDGLLSLSDISFDKNLGGSANVSTDGAVSGSANTTNTTVTETAIAN